jgi:hypothetical protein
MITFGSFFAAMGLEIIDLSTGGMGGGTSSFFRLNFENKEFPVLLAACGISLMLLVARI